MFTSHCSVFLNCHIHRLSRVLKSPTTGNKVYQKNKSLRRKTFLINNNQYNNNLRMCFKYYLCIHI